MTIDTYIEKLAEDLQAVDGELLFKTHKSDFIAGFNTVTQQKDLFRDLDTRVSKAEIGVLTYDLLKYVKNTSSIKELISSEDWSVLFLDENIRKQCKAIGILIALQSEGLIDSKFVVDKKVFETYESDLSKILTQNVKGSPNRIQIKDAIAPIQIEKFDFLDLIFIGQSFNIGKDSALENLKKYYKSRKKGYLYTLNIISELLNHPKGFLDRKFSKKVEKDNHSLLKGYLLTLETLSYELELPKGHVFLNYFPSITSADGLSETIDLNHFYEQEETFKEFLVNKS